MNKFCITLGIYFAMIAPSASFADAPAFKLRSQHPYLYFTADNVAKLKERIKNEKTTEVAYTRMLESANRSLDQAGPTNNIEQLCLAYRMTGDTKFAEKVREFLLREIKRPNWGEADLLLRDPPWNAGLGTARSCYSAAAAFDSIYDFLSEADREAIARGIVDLGILPTMNDWVLGQSRIHSLDTMGHNWWSACVFMAGIASMAVMNEEPRAVEWLNRIHDAELEWVTYSGSTLETKPRTFDSGGAFWESANYASFGLSEYLLYRLAWSNAFESPNPPEVPILGRLGDYFLDMCYPNSGRLMTVNFGDGSLNVDGSRVVLLSWALGHKKPRYLWYLKQVGGEAYREGMDRSSPLGMIYYPTESEMSAAPASPDLPPSNLYKDIGWATLRSSWDKDATLLAVKSGFTWNHSHADEGSFILFHHGQNLLIDSGNCNYSQPEYDAYYRQSQAHNVILFNGEGENPEDTYHGSQFPGSVSNLIDAGDLKYIWADATGPVAKNFIRNFRHFLWIGDVILIIDDLKTYQPGQIEWLLHFDGVAKLQGLDLNISEKDARISVRPLFPETFPTGLPHDFPDNMKLVEKAGLKDHEPQTKVTYYALTPPGQTRQTTFITAIVLDNGAASAPKIERLVGKDMIGVRVRQGGTITDIYANLLAEGRIRHIDPILKIGVWETDAYLSAFTYPEGADPSQPDSITRYFIADGSYLRQERKVVLDSLSKVFATWKHSNGEMNMILQGQPSINARVFSAEKPMRVTLNSAPAQVQFDSNSHLISLHAGHEATK